MTKPKPRKVVHELRHTTIFAFGQPLLMFWCRCGATLGRNSWPRHARAAERRGERVER